MTGERFRQIIKGAIPAEDEEGAFFELLAAVCENKSDAAVMVAHWQKRLHGS